MNSPYGDILVRLRSIILVESLFYLSFRALIRNFYILPESCIVQELWIG